KVMIEYSLTLAGNDCCLVEWNPGGENLVFALHGWLDNLATFESLANYMPNTRFIAVDSPGHGHSAHIEQDKAYHFIDGVYLIDDLIEHFGQQSINLLGHSMGGALATIYASVQPKRIKNLLLIEAIGPVTTKESEFPETLRNSLTQRRLLKDKRKPFYSSFNLALEARANVSNISPDLIKPLVERALTTIDNSKDTKVTGYTWRADSRLRSSSAMRMTEAQLRCLLPLIEAPTLLIEGKQGLLQLPDTAHVQARKSLIKNLKVELLEGGHHLHLEYPQMIAQIISDFMSANQ
ncbi:MAG: alpha/beta fold hydrolase, partial [Kangiellaceae bacterium]